MEPPPPRAPERRTHRHLGLRSPKWAVGGAVLTAFLLASCQVPSFGAQHPVTKQAQDEFKLWQGFAIAGIVVGGLVALLILWTVFRYRKRSTDIPKQTQYHTLIEIFYTVIPILIVVALFVATVLTENEITARPPSPVNVKVVAFQWGWDFRYPADGVQVIGRSTPGPNGITAPPPIMVLPEGENVAITLHSNDVIHGFYVPQFNYSEYAMPGYDNHFVINPTKVGEFRGQCTQLCGLYHSLMLFNVIVLPPSQYAKWLAKSKVAIARGLQGATFTASYGGQTHQVPLATYLSPKGSTV